MPPLDGIWSFWLLSAVAFSLTGPRTLLATVASWDTTLSTVLSGGGTGELAEELEPEVDEGDTLRLAAAAAQSLRLSASFFSLGIPGEEQEGRVSWLSAVKLSVVLMVVGLESVVLRELVVFVTVVVEGTAVPVLTRVCPSDLGSDGAAFTMGLFKSEGGAGLRKVSLLTEMNALPGVEKGRGPWMGFVLGSKTFLSCLTLSSTDETDLGSFTPRGEANCPGFVSETEGSVCKGVGLPTCEGPVWENVA